MNITSPMFKSNQRIPDNYTCQGLNINPPLIFSDLPEDTRSFALILDDPDAVSVDVWDHWIVFNINSDVRGVGENSVPEGGIQVTNSFGQIEYGGPCPPPGNVHHYRFKLYALNAKLDHSLVTDKISLLEAIKPHTLVQAELVGLYSR